MRNQSLMRAAAATQSPDALDASPEERLRQSLAADGRFGDARIRAGTVGVASPMRLATEWAGFVVECGAHRVYAKVMHADMRALLDFGRTVAASRAAERAGVSPALVHADAANGVLLFDYLAAPAWRWARVDELAHPARRDALFALLRQLQAGSAPELACHPPFDDITRLRQLCLNDGASLPSDEAWIDECVALADNALATRAAPARPAHGDNVASNVLTGPQETLRLVDFDYGGQMDPWFDIATTLNELYPFEDEWRSGIVAWSGHCDEADYARCRLYALLDDWRWTLQGLWTATVTNRPLEFFKLAQWTLLRCRQTLRDPRFESWLRYVQG